MYVCAYACVCVRGMVLSMVICVLCVSVHVHACMRRVFKSNIYITNTGLPPPPPTHTHTGLLLPDTLPDMQVTKLWFANGNYTGSLPAAWSRLTNLQVLNLSSNALTGTLPPEWSGLAGLQLLDLNSNAINGTLPRAWGSMAGLQVLDLTFNALNGTLPPSWSRLACLEVPDLNLLSSLLLSALLGLGVGLKY